VDISAVFIASARARAAELSVASQVGFVHGDASGYVASGSAGIVRRRNVDRRDLPPRPRAMPGISASTWDGAYSR
jgi:hypothetical protein